MKREIDIKATCSILQDLPLEISFEQVEQWVKNAPNNTIIANRWLPYWLVKLASWRPYN